MRANRFGKTTYGNTPTYAKNGACLDRPKAEYKKAAQRSGGYLSLLRNRDINHPNQAWCSNIIYIHMPGGFVYPMAVMDWYSRYILSWELSIK